MKFEEELFLLLIDKIVIAGIAFYIWHVYSKRKEAERRELDKITLLEKEKKELFEDKIKNEFDMKIQVVETQIDKLYWPLHLCMKKDDAVWQRVPSLYDGETLLPTKMGAYVEEEFILPNHEKAVKVIEDNFHLVADDPILNDVFIKYITHVAVFRSLRLSKSKENPIDVDEPFPENLPELIELGLNEKRKELKNLKDKQNSLGT